MPPQKWLYRRIGLVRGVFLTAFACGTSPLLAQDALQLQRTYPGSAPFVCPSPVAPIGEVSPQRRAQGGQTASEADNALILGEYERARELFAQAAELDPASADIAYNHARVLETLGRVQESMVEYCRAIALGSDDGGVGDAQDRIDALDVQLRARIPQAAREHFADGLAEANAARYPQSVQAFTNALGVIPDWPEALYNRAVVYELMGMARESLIDYRRYLQLRPDEVDPQVASVAQRIGMLEGIGSIPTASPGNTLALGMLLPGMGQYYSGRGVSGTVFLGSAVTALTVGLSYQKITVRCLSDVPAGGDCPTGDIVDQSSERPLLGPALAVVAAVTLTGAIEAWVRARQARAEQEENAAPAPEGLTLSGPSLSYDGRAIDVRFFSLRFH